ncbi:polyadenylate-binding protein 4-like [Stegodyphus dumicola]|uniref:polyadenylate-binding protein 4-like n=1 Tax=Stegodyphus dumicola TaxID=202533 RepID=UPI0015A77110|nr:polyadenylate-binding protein 4-like [Stegodyphus dumicola]
MTSLYVGNLHPDCDEATLYKKFSAVGKILNIRICTDVVTKSSLGYGYVNYMDPEDAKKALNTLNYDLVMGRAIRIMWDDKNIFNKCPMSANLFVKNLHPNIDERILYDVFANYGNIVSLKVATDENGQSKGFAFIQFENEESANKAIDCLNEKLLLGHQLYVSKFIPRDKRLEQTCPRFTNIYLKNFKSTFKDEDLQKLCEKFGTILSAKVMTDENGDSKKFGFVNFTDPECAQEAIRELNGKTVDGQVLYVGRAKKKSERRAEVLANLKKTFHRLYNHEKS